MPSRHPVLRISKTLTGCFAPKNARQPIGAGPTAGASARYFGGVVVVLVVVRTIVPCGVFTVVRWRTLVT